MQATEARDQFGNAIRPGTLLGINHRYSVGVYVVSAVKVWKRGADQGHPYVYGAWTHATRGRLETQIKHPHRGVIIHLDHADEELRELRLQILAEQPVEDISVYDPEDA